MIAKDHLGKVYPSLKAMATAWGISVKLLSDRLDRGMSVEGALTRPVRPYVNGPVRDHLGREFLTKKAMAESWGIAVVNLFNRIRLGWSIEDALTKPVRHKREE